MPHRCLPTVRVWDRAHLKHLYTFLSEVNDSFTDTGSIHTPQQMGGTLDIQQTVAHHLTLVSCVKSLGMCIIYTQSSWNFCCLLQFYYPFSSLKYMLTLHIFHNISLLPVQMNKYLIFMLFRILDFLKWVIQSMKYILLYILSYTNVYFSVNRF